MQVLELNSKDYDGSRHSIGEEKIDPAFRKIKQNSIGFYVWKVENDRVEPVPKEKFGQFHDNTTYIIYAAASSGSFVNCNSINREAKNGNQVPNKYVHFWLGANTTPERSGAVAYKVIELDNHMGNTAVQYRETQENESTRFTAYFKEGLIVLCDELQENGVRLFQMKGKKCPTCVQRPVGWPSFCSAHIMLFQTHSYVFVWIGRASSQSERHNALKMARRLQDLYGIQDVATVDDGYEQSMSSLKKTDWNKHLSLANRIVNPTVQLDAPVLPLFKLYKCGFTNSKYRIEEVKSSFLQQTDLNDAEAAFIVDCGCRGVWIWLGRNSFIKDKAEAMRNARGFVKKKKYPSTTPVVRVVDGFEPGEFTNIFPIWRRQITNDGTANNKCARVLGKFDAHTLFQRPKLAATSQLIDDGTGDLTIYKVNSNSLLEIPRRKLVALFSGDCFLIHYIVTFADSNLLPGGHLPVVRHILYLWTGSQCPNDIRNAGEQLTTELYQHLRKNAMQVRIHEGNEPPHFLQIFTGKLIIFNGKASDYDVAGGSASHPSTYLLKVTGDSTYNSKAVQVTSRSQFTSKDCLVLTTIGQDVWVWCGQSSTGDTREIAKAIGSAVGEYSLALESNEPDEFWRCLPDKIETKLRMAKEATNGMADGYAGTDATQSAMVDEMRVGLYVVSAVGSGSGQMVLRQVMAFEQADLVPEDVFLLDVGSSVFVWTGSLCNTTDKQACWRIANYFLSNYSAPRDLNTTVALVNQGSEPMSFIGHFDEWNSKLWDDHKSFEVERALFESPNEPLAALSMNNNNQSELDAAFDGYPKYPADMLRSEASQLPDAIDPKQKEVYLTHDDFVSIFQMKFMEFETLPNWRKQELKKRHKLF